MDGGVLNGRETSGPGPCTRALGLPRRHRYFGKIFGRHAARRDANETAPFSDSPSADSGGTDHDEPQRIIPGNRDDAACAGGQTVAGPLARGHEDTARFGGLRLCRHP